jgi:signal-transduction protein with cAMP-binding, CBS, and nucleotidyltransferase domain
MSDTVTLKKPRFDFTADTLPEHPLFDGLPTEFRKILAECGLRTDFEEGATVLEAGEPANGFYLVTRGTIDLETHGVRYPSRVQSLSEGDILGWSWLFPPYFWHFNALARQPVETVFFYGSYLRQQCDRNHDFGYEVVKRLSRILVGRLQGDRERWIEAAQSAPMGAEMLPYLVI